LQSAYISSDDDRLQAQAKALVPPEEKVRKLLYQLIVESNPLTAIERRYLVEAAKLVEIRANLAEFFLSFTQPRKLNSKECF
jgi:hypothetical protein